MWIRKMRAVAEHGSTQIGGNLQFGGDQRESAAFFWQGPGEKGRGGEEE
jgi:hypothetical protein